MFSIRKNYKIQVLYRLDTHTADILKLRKPTTTKGLIESTTEQINQITSLTTSQETNKIINKFFSDQDSNESIKNLSKLFQKFPHIFHDLIRVVSKHRSFHDGKWLIQEDDETNIAEVFLFEKRPADIGSQIPGFIKLICKNQDFIKFTEKQHSLLDLGYFGCSKIPSKDRKKLIEKLIETSIAENIPSSKKQHLNFGAVREKICKYLNKIYGVDTSDFHGVNDASTLAEKINKCLSDKSAKTQKVAWKILQGWYSWGAIQEIEDQEKKYKNDKFQSAIQSRIEGVFGSIIPTSSEEIDGTTLHHGTFDFKGKKIEISWRIKSTESILMKTWEDEDYGYISSLRDRLGISLTFPDDTHDNDIAALMKQGSSLLSNNGYILKNKGLIDAETMGQIHYESGKSPLFTSTKPGGDPNMQNASQSGFAGITIGESTLSVGTELQYSKKSAMEWKKRENTIYKFRALFNSLLRGESIDTPQSIYNSIKKKIPNEDMIQGLVDPDSGHSLNLKNHHDLMKYLIEKNILIPYFGIVNKVDIVVLTTPPQQDNATKEWKIQPVKKDTAEGSVHNKLLNYIDSLV